ncbi:MAG: 8-oxoguanine deaminase [Candidatus Marinimicrobia bacterium]|jgi:cytosine/adenosine deaminase-related metal-dependent hydrolase|nr:8-oxoguanine deaminase [Candidatus Neomarinimicrobiota bacterium]MDD4960703.1 8-oxoguanine deaminase [Candidatus Neomarinimicrobiota bacterium]MDD5710364.1 8-oxoguanine deaminase [Candidatus Neomarinimicrobiota bacterium]MDX9777180.1 8-oxoguanine deaminase [bacterium]
MNSSILIRDPLLCCRMKADIREADPLDTFSGGHIYLEAGKILSAGPEPFRGTADMTIDASRMLVLPGFVNTHHHFFQTLTRNILATQRSELFDWLKLNYEIWRGISGEAFYISAKTAMAELMKTGCSTSSDHLYLFPRDAEASLIDREISAAGELGMRFHPTRGSMSLSVKDGGLPPEDVVQDEEAIFNDIERLVKRYHDPRDAAMLKIALAPCSPFSVTPSSMRKTVDVAEKYGLQIHTHLAETRDEEQFCLDKFGKRPFKFMQDLGWIRSNAWFAHSIYLNDAEITAAGKAAAGVAHCPSSNMRLGSGIARIREMLDAGVSVGIGVDGSASNDASNMLLEIRNAMLISRLRAPKYWLNTEEVLWMATRGGAKALGRGDIGQILPGKCADICMISMDRLEYAGAAHDPAAAVVFNAALEPVDWLLVNGEIVVKKGKITGLDEPGLIRRQQELSAALITRAEKRLPRALARVKI